MSRFLGLTLACILASASTTAVAQGDAMTELYGEGVHRYFAGDYTGADMVLSQVVDAGSLDPRAHYFRGLTREMLGSGGQPDFDNGARLETQGKRVVNVGQALIRIQGSMRTAIEKARRAARVEAKQLALAKAAVTPAAALEAETPPPAPADTAGATAPAEVDDPFGEGLRSDATTEDAVQPATATASDETVDPFADDAPSTPAPAATEPAGNDPFGGGDAGGNDPFGGTSGGDDPFGGAGAGSSGDASSDPFGGSGGSDPFGGSAGGDDPFGGSPF